MTEAQQSSGSAASGSTGGGWFSNLPEWARWAIPVMLVFLGVGLIATFLRYTGGGSSDPESQVQSLCQAAVQDDLEARGNTVEDLPLFSDVEQVDDAEYRTQGSVSYDEDGESEQRTVRCVVRVDEDGTMQVASVRFGG
ncbi:hypothetical protein [Agromyces mariniharenae]|uniref:Uncharacterized protein n=1 Tax=Agromyces mariniharenae TaxID=2604423 RepID=A0A5S4UTT0_9MICO|nr:hypothetical protein [Agromyces mariniharenae]TYL50384.1 hypothetical protein FYC51_14320 [Agromyces mariniharenae]